MKKVIVLSPLFVVNLVLAQDKKIAKSGVITFEASVPSFEEVKATNASTTVVLNTQTAEIASLVLIKGFRFKIALMEEHFNENYIESDRYPKAVFRGKIENFDTNSITATPKDFIVNGTLELHGKSVPIRVVLKMNQLANGLHLSTNFSVNASDFDIKIQSVVSHKLSNKIKIQLQAVLK